MPYVYISQLSVFRSMSKWSMWKEHINFSKIFEIAMLNGYSGIRTRNFGLCLPSLLVGQTMTRQSWTGSLDECPDPQLDYQIHIFKKLASNVDKPSSTCVASPIVPKTRFWFFFQLPSDPPSLIDIFNLPKILHIYSHCLLWFNLRFFYSENMCCSKI